MFTVRVHRRSYRKIPAHLVGPTRVKIGFPAGKADGLTVSKAVWNEFGTRGGASGGGWGGPIPERPFMRNAVKSNVFPSFLKATAKSILSGAMTLTVAMNKLGQLGERTIQDEIDAMKSPPNSPITIALKGSSHPLIAIGEMRQSVTYKVDE